MVTNTNHLTILCGAVASAQLRLSEWTMDPASLLLDRRIGLSGKTHMGSRSRPTCRAQTAPAYASGPRSHVLSSGAGPRRGPYTRGYALVAPRPWGPAPFSGEGVMGAKAGASREH